MMAKKKDNPKPIWNGPEGSMQGEWVTLDELDDKRPMPSDESLRAKGYMTTAEFVEKFERGLSAYLAKNWGFCGVNNLTHPEDLAANTLAYAEAVWETIQVFGAGDTNEK